MKFQIYSTARKQLKCLPIWPKCLRKKLMVFNNQLNVELRENFWDILGTAGWNGLEEIYLVDH